ncbi:MAG TPA: hypothetical protein VJ793_05660 [Anaerolineae bacterium]|nr:hypothetical protein [Anaerolineae bacterium]
MSQVILVLILAVAIVVGGGYILNGCTSTIADSVEVVASVNSPQNQAAGNTAKLLGEVQARAEAIRVEVLTRGQAELQIERERTLQELTLNQQRNQQEAEHTIRMNQVYAESSVRMADIEAERIESTARASVAWVEPAAAAAVTVLVVVGVVVAGVIGARTIGRMGSAWATKVEHQANVPMMFNYDPNTLTAPVILAIVSGQPTLINPNTGEVLLLTQAHNAEAARLRYLAMQNAIALQTRGDGKRDALIIPNVDAEVSSNGR